MYFKKHIAFFLAVFLLFSNVGLAVSLHYCQGKIEKATLSYHFASDVKKNTDESHSCCNDKSLTKEKKKTCCSDEIIKQSNEQMVVKVFNFHVDAFVFYRYSSLFFNTSTSVLVPKNTYTAFYIDKKAPPLFKLYHQFLLYA